MRSVNGSHDGFVDVYEVIREHLYSITVDLVSALLVVIGSDVGELLR
jgi:hypothetical protein